MINDIKKMIDDDNEVLNILPQNNVNNRKKYLKELTTIKKKYTNMKEETEGYIILKNGGLKKKYDIPHEDSLSKFIEDLEKKISYFNPYHDAYEILGLDKLFYCLHKYYDNDLTIYNNTTNKILDIFDQVGVEIKADDFYFSDSAKEYLEVLINERKSGNHNSKIIKDTFEKLFWKNHNMMRYILLNFKHIYYENEKKFNEYVKKVQQSILGEYDNSFENLVKKYQDLVHKSNDSYLINYGVFYRKFMNKEITVNDYEKEKIEKLISEYLNSTSTNNSKEIFMKLYASINEEMFIFRNKIILDEVDKLFQEKDSFKNLVSGTRKEITTIEKTIYKKHKKLNSRCLFKNKKNDNIINKEIEDSLLELDNKYDELDENRYKEKIGTMVNPSVKDYLLLGKSYMFMVQICKEKEEEPEHYINDIEKNIYCPYDVLVENINYANVETLNLIVYDKYRLIGLSLTTDDFVEDNLDGLSKVISNIIIYYTLIELNIKLDEISFIIDSDEIIKKLS